MTNGTPGTRDLPRRVLGPVQEFMRLEVAGGLVLLVASIAALVWANVATVSYEDFWSTSFSAHLGGIDVDEDLLHVVNDGLMAIFFLVVGLEVKRELAIGELSTRQAALLPLFAAGGGMLLPALIYLGVMGGGDGSQGWGIPMATDVAFALAALAALGSRMPTALAAFLLGVAVIDDVGAILVIAIYYTDGIILGWLALALAALAAMVVAQRMRVHSPVVYVALGLVAWFATFESGVHATIAGVAVGLLTPVRPLRPPGPDDPDPVSPLERLEHLLHPWSSFVVLPIFALANAGIVIDSASIDAATETPVALAVILGLVVGKTLGLTAGAALAVRLRLSRLPPGVGWSHLVGLGALAGIGFTVSLFITELAFDDPDVIAAAKLGVLAGSVARGGGGDAAAGRGDPARAVRPRGGRLDLADPRDDERHPDHHLERREERRRPRDQRRPGRERRGGDDGQRDRGGAEHPRQRLVGARADREAGELRGHEQRGEGARGARARQRVEARDDEHQPRGDAERLGADVEPVQQGVGDAGEHDDQDGAGAEQQRGLPRRGAALPARERDPAGVRGAEESGDQEAEGHGSACPAPRRAATACCWSSIWV